MFLSLAVLLSMCILRFFMFYLDSLGKFYVAPFVFSKFCLEVLVLAYSSSNILILYSSFEYLFSLMGFPSYDSGINLFASTCFIFSHFVGRLCLNLLLLHYNFVIHVGVHKGNVILK